MFGCIDEKDLLKHYLRCDALWAVGAAASETCARPDILSILCILDPRQEGIEQIVLAYHLYHKVKFEKLEVFKRIACVEEFIKETSNILKGVNRMFCSDLECLKSFDHELAKKVNPGCVGKKTGDPTPVVQYGRGMR